MRDSLTQSQKFVIESLRKNSRIKFTEMSRLSMIPIVTIHDAYTRLSKRKIIQRCYSIVNYVKLGFFQRSFLAVKCTDPELLKRISLSKNVNSLTVCVESSQKYCFMEVIFRDRTALFKFIDELGLNSSDIIIYEIWSIEKEEDFDLYYYFSFGAG